MAILKIKNPNTGLFEEVLALKGEPGDAATIAVGTVTTLAPGSAATVTNAGTPDVAVFDFGIPQGAAGTTYTHPTGDGNLHVPATGTTNSGKVLTAGATAGSLSWTTPAASGVTSVAAGAGLNFTTFTTTGSIVLGTPSTLTTTTINSASGTTHSHSITTTTSGAASTIVATDSSGNITATDTYNFGIAADIKYNSTTKSIDFIFA